MSYDSAWQESATDALTFSWVCTVDWCNGIITAIQAPVAREAPTPFVGLREPAPLTPVIDEAHALHAKASLSVALASA